MKPILLVLVSFLLFTSKPVIAQILPDVHADMETYAFIIPRTLLVEIREADQAALIGYQEKIDKAKKKAEKDTLIKEKEQYLAVIKNYNALIKSTVSTYWTFNKTIEFKTTSELKAISAADYSKYVLLYFKYETDNEAYGLATHMYIPFVYYNRMEVSHFSRPNRYPDYKMYVPSSFLRPLSEYTSADFIFMIKAMQLNMSYNSMNPKKLNFIQYAELRASKNCTMVASKQLLIEDILKRPEIAETEAGNLCQTTYSFVSATDITKAMKEGEMQNAVIMSFPYALQKTGGDVQYTYLVYAKVVVDAETGEVLNYYEPFKGKEVFYEAPIRKEALVELCGCSKKSR